MRWRFLLLRRKPPEPPEFSADDIATPDREALAEAYAATTGAPKSKAIEQLRLQEQAVSWVNDLVSSSVGETIVDVEIRHAPGFKVVVFYENGFEQQNATRGAPVELRLYLIFRSAKKDKNSVQTERRQIAQALRTARIPFGLGYEPESERFIVTIPDGFDEQLVRNALPSALAANVEIKTGATSVDSATLYGGWFYEKSNSGTHCTAGWPIRDSAGKEAILTAGHCRTPSNTMNFYYQNAVLSEVSAYADSNNGWQTLDYAMYRLGTHATAPYINIENGRTVEGEYVSVPGYATNYYLIDYPKEPVRGQFICKMGVNTGLTCGRITELNYTDSEYSNLVRMSESAQRYIGLRGDSGGPVFAFRTSDNAAVHPIGLAVKASVIETYRGTEKISERPCRNTSTVGANNTTCHVLFMRLSTIRGYSPYTINTISGFRAP